MRTLIYGEETIIKSLLSQSVENIMNGKDYQRRSIEKDRNRQRNSATIQDEEITIPYLVTL